MKRSDLVSAISEFINKEIPIESCGSNEEIYKSNIKGWSEKILDLLESEGMLPPFAAKIKQVDIIDKWSVSTGRTEMIRVIEPQWDEE